MLKAYNVLFLCTGNSARSIIAEAILNKVGAGKFNAYSAGSHPRGCVHPETLRLLQRLGYDVGGFRSKSWDEFTGHNAPPSISSSPFATTRPPKPVRIGLAAP